jgi:hypothetical protein
MRSLPNLIAAEEKTKNKKTRNKVNPTSGKYGAAEPLPEKQFFQTIPAIL